MFVVVGLIGMAWLAPSAVAQQRFLFSTDPEKLVNEKPDLDVRPNVSQSFFLFVFNERDDENDITVTLSIPDGPTLTGVAKAVPNKQHGRVRFAKPMPPMPAAAPMPVPMPMPMGPPPPPGTELLAKAQKYTFTLRAFDAKSKDKPLAVRETTVSIRQPRDYVTVSDIRFTRNNAERLLFADLRATTELGEPPVTVELQFPRQDNLQADMLRDGVYRRSLSKRDQTVRLFAENLPFPKKTVDENGRVYIAVDGIARAFIFEPAFHRDSDNARVVEFNDSAVRVYEKDKKDVVTTVYSRPIEGVPLRVEVDNPPTGATLELRVDRARNRRFEQPDEIIAKSIPREERIWLDPAGPAEAVQITTRVNDWMLPVDMRDTRGKIAFEAALVRGGKPIMVKRGDGSLAAVTHTGTFIIDDTPPEEVTIGTLPKKHVRGQPLRVEVFARDPESDIAKVVVFLGKPGPDGKLPDGEKIEAVKSPAGGGLWIAMVPLAADKKGEIDLSAQATNSVGMTANNVQKIVLVDPPPPPTTGTIIATVELQRRPQPNVAVVMKDAEGKDKGAAKTNDKGEVKFEKVPPGVYKLSAARADASTGTKGEEGITVEAGKEHKITINLARGP
jgi:hypothetical protein